MASQKIALNKEPAHVLKMLGAPLQIKKLRRKQATLIAATASAVLNDHKDPLKHTSH